MHLGSDAVDLKNYRPASADQIAARAAWFSFRFDFFERDRSSVWRSRPF
jgi:hypothetical protein